MESSFPVLIIQRYFPGPLSVPYFRKVERSLVYIKQEMGQGNPCRDEKKRRKNTFFKFFLTLCPLVLSADNFCKQFGPRSGPTECRSWSGSNCLSSYIVFLKEIFEKNPQTAKKACKISQYAKSLKVTWYWGFLKLNYLHAGHHP